MCENCLSKFFDDTLNWLDLEEKELESLFNRNGFSLIPAVGAANSASGSSMLLVAIDAIVGAGGQTAANEYKVWLNKAIFHQQ